MADSTDVQDALAALIGQILYPDGTSLPSAVCARCKIYPGWPDSNTLNADLADGVAHISVFATPYSKSVPQMMPVWQPLSITPPTIVLNVTGQILTLSGTVSTPQNVVIQQRSGITAYAVQANDSLESIATAIATLIPGASSTGDEVTMPDMYFTAAISTGAKVLREVGRQQQVFQISVWTNTPKLRASIASLIDPAIRVSERLTMPDGTAAQMWFAASKDNDDLQKQALYVRHLRFNGEFATTQTENATTIGAVGITTEVVPCIDPTE